MSWQGDQRSPKKKPICIGGYRWVLGHVSYSRHPDSARQAFVGYAMYTAKAPGRRDYAQSEGPTLTLCGKRLASPFSVPGKRFASPFFSGTGDLHWSVQGGRPGM